MYVFYIHIYSYTYICIYMWYTHAHIYVCMFTFESESPEVTMAQNSQCRPGWLWMFKGMCYHIWLYLNLVCFIDDILCVALLNLGYKFISTCPVGQSNKENDQLQDWCCPSIFQTVSMEKLCFLLLTQKIPFLQHLIYGTESDGGSHFFNSDNIDVNRILICSTE